MGKHLLVVCAIVLGSGLLVGCGDSRAPENAPAPAPATEAGTGSDSAAVGESAPDEPETPPPDPFIAAESADAQGTDIAELRVLAESLLQRHAEPETSPSEDSQPEQTEPAPVDAASDIVRALGIFRRLSEANPEDAELRAGLTQAGMAALAQAEHLLAQDETAKARSLFARLAGVPELPAERLTLLESELVRNEAIETALATARGLERRGRWFAPAQNNAAATLLEALQLDPGHERARTQLDALTQRRIEAAFAAVEQSKPKQADAILAEIGRVLPDSARVQDAAARLVELRETRFAALLGQFHAATDQGDDKTAEPLFQRIEREALRDADIEAARAELERARRYGRYAPGQSFNDALTDGGYGPDMVVLPHGSFRMGTPESEEHRYKNEGPRHKVSFTNGFALARTETTVAQFRRFIEATGYKPHKRPRASVYDEKGGAMSERRGVTWKHDYIGREARPDAPVLYLTWEDASAYVTWLAQATGQPYRLPSEAEFEYALRGGGTTAYPWGDTITPPGLLENLTGEGDASPRGRRFGNVFKGYSDGHWGPAPAGSFAANAFGLHDLNGNVSEWVLDCWHDNYNRAPPNGSAWVNPGCAKRVVRGSSWASAPDQARSGYRQDADGATRNARLGFRVARDLR